MRITITAKECEETKSSILVDPCAFIECSTLNCDHCPLSEAAQTLREAQDKFIDIINSLERGE